MRSVIVTTFIPCTDETSAVSNPVTGHVSFVNYLYLNNLPIFYIILPIGLMGLNWKYVIYLRNLTVNIGSLYM